MNSYLSQLQPRLSGLPVAIDYSRKLRQLLYLITKKIG
jgi:hypothetical protein